MIQKRYLRNSRDAKELFAELGLTERKPKREELPGIFVFRPPVDNSQRPGEILAIVTFDDFVDAEVYRESEQLLELLTGKRFQGNIDPANYPIVEQSMRRLVNCRNELGKHVVFLTNEARKAESLYNGMVDYETLRIMKEDGEDRVTVAKTMARSICIEYRERWIEAKMVRDKGINLEKSISKTVDIYRTILAKLRKEYEDISFTETT